jgi:hypothetical protein
MEVLVGLPPLDLVIQWGGEIGGTSPLELGVLVLPSPPTRIQLHMGQHYEAGLFSRTQI